MAQVTIRTEYTLDEWSALNPDERVALKRHKGLEPRTARARWHEDEGRVYLEGEPLANEAQASWDSGYLRASEKGQPTWRIYQDGVLLFAAHDEKQARDFKARNPLRDVGDWMVAWPGEVVTYKGRPVNDVLDPSELPDPTPEHVAELNSAAEDWAAGRIIGTTRETHDAQYPWVAVDEYGQEIGRYLLSQDAQRAKGVMRVYPADLLDTARSEGRGGLPPVAAATATLHRDAYAGSPPRSSLTDRIRKWLDDAGKHPREEAIAQTAGEIKARQDMLLALGMRPVPNLPGAWLEPGRS